VGLWDENPGTIDDCQGVWMSARRINEQTAVIPGRYHNPPAVSPLLMATRIKRWMGPGVFLGRINSRVATITTGCGKEPPRRSNPQLFWRVRWLLGGVTVVK